MLHDLTNFRENYQNDRYIEVKLIINLQNPAFPDLKNYCYNISLPSYTQLRHWKLKNRQRALFYDVSATRNLKRSLIKISIRTQETKYRKENTRSSYFGPMHPSLNQDMMSQPASKLSGALWQRGGKRKENSVATTSLEFKHLYRKSRCEMLIGGDDISNDVITLDWCFAMLVYIRADWRKSDSSVEFKFQRRSWKEHPGELAPRLMIRQNKSHI